MNYSGIVEKSNKAFLNTVLKWTPAAIVGGAAASVALGAVGGFGVDAINQATYLYQTPEELAEVDAEYIRNTLEGFMTTIGYTYLEHAKEGATAGGIVGALGIAATGTAALVTNSPKIVAFSCKTLAKGLLAMGKFAVGSLKSKVEEVSDKLMETPNSYVVADENGNYGIADLKDIKRRANSKLETTIVDAANGKVHKKTVSHEGVRKKSFLKRGNKYETEEDFDYSPNAPQM